MNSNWLDIDGDLFPKRFAAIEFFSVSKHSIRVDIEHSSLWYHDINTNDMD